MGTRSHFSRMMATYILYIGKRGTKLRISHMLNFSECCRCMKYTTATIFLLLQNGVAYRTLLLIFFQFLIDKRDEPPRCPGCVLLILLIDDKMFFLFDNAQKKENESKHDEADVHE